MRDLVVGRRRMLAYLGMAAAGVTVAACGGPEEPVRAHPARRPKPETPVSRSQVASMLPEEDAPVVRSELVHSKYRNATIELLIIHPSGLESTENLPMALYLHGRDGVQPTPIPFDTLTALEVEHREGRIEPFGIVTVDGGYNPYWTDGQTNGDLLSMLMEEVPGWLRERGLGDADGVPFASSGISTGGFGALNYAIERNLAGAPVSRVATLSPALSGDWQQMREKNAFTSKQQWLAVDPLHRVEDLGDVPLGVWIGSEDAFLEPVSRLVDQHPNTPVVEVLEGGHDPDVFEQVGPDMVRFLAEGITLSG